MTSKSFARNFHIDFQKNSTILKEKHQFTMLSNLYSIMISSLLIYEALELEGTPDSLTVGLLSKLRIYLIPFHVPETLFLQNLSNIHKTFLN